MMHLINLFRCCCRVLVFEVAFLDYALAIQSVFSDHLVMEKSFRFSIKFQLKTMDFYLKILNYTLLIKSFQEN